METKLPVIKLRGHHLICLHFFHGEGYNLEFITNLRKIMKRVEDGERIITFSKADDVCEICPYLREGICSYNTESDEEIREMDRTALTLLQLTPGSRVNWSDIKEKITGIFSQWSQRYCKVCDWRQACEKEEKFLRFIKGLPR